MSLVIHVPGPAVGNHTLMTNRLAGMLAGTIYKALGEWLSMQRLR